MKKPALLFLLGAVALGLSSCNESEESESAAAPEPNPKFQAVMLDAEPEGAVSVIESREKVTPGSEVTVVGRVAGAMEPFSEGYATFVLADKTLETCEQIEGDGCATPWDACCVAGDTIKASRLTVQLTDENGQVLEGNLKGVNGLTELDELVVSGTIAEESTDENVVINASGIYRKTPEA